MMQTYLRRFALAAFLIAALYPRALEAQTYTTAPVEQLQGTAVTISSRSYPVFAIVNADGTLATIPTYREDDSHTSLDKGIQALGVRGSGCGTPLSGTAGDYQPNQYDSRGSLCVTIDQNTAGSATVTEAATETAGVANAAIVSAYIKAFDGTTFARLRSRAGLIGSSDVGLVTRPFAWSDGTNTAPTMDAVGRPGFQKITDGTNTMPTMDSVARPGFMKVTDGTNSVVVDPCAGNAKVYTPISQTTGTRLIVGTSAKKIYVCSIVLVGADAENVSLVAGTGSVCATSTVAVIGGTTAAAGPNLAANGGFSAGNGASSIAATTVNADDLCLFQSASGRVAGVMTSVVQ